MLSNAKEKIIKNIQTKKGWQKTGLCLVEGEKIIKAAGSAVEFTFSKEDTPNFAKLVTTESPQDIAGVARIPKWEIKDLVKNKTIVVLDGVQDPGNVGSILRLCLGFGASLILVESADPGNPKVIRSSVGAMFQTPWISIKRNELENIIKKIKLPVYRLEKRDSKILSERQIQKMKKGAIIIAGSEGKGIITNLEGESIEIKHNKELESLNVTHAITIILKEIYT